MSVMTHSRKDFLWFFRRFGVVAAFFGGHVVVRCTLLRFSLNGCWRVLQSFFSFYKLRIVSPQTMTPTPTKSDASQPAMLLGLNVIFVGVVEVLKQENNGFGRQRKRVDIKV